MVGTLGVLWTLESLVPWIPDRQHRVRHGAINLGLGGINALLAGLVFAAAAAAVTESAAQRQFGLLHLLPVSGLAASALAVILMDFWQYVWHRINHAVPLLWRFHAVHHADRHLDASTGVRFHTGEIFASALIRLAALPVFGLSLGQVLLYEAIAMPVVLFHHSNVRMPGWLDAALRTVVVTPGVHRTHHSTNRQEHDSNYASIFTWWDRMFATYRGAVPDIVPGLAEVPDAEWKTVTGIIKQPFTARPSSPAPDERDHSHPS